MTHRGQAARQAPGGAGKRTARWVLAAVLLCLPAISGAARADSSATADLARIEAAFLRNFAHYVAWPAEAFADDHAPWRVCVVGGDPFGDSLDDTLRGRTEQGRAFVVEHAASLAEIRDCHIVYLGYRAGENRRAALAELANRPVLTVSDAPGFLQEGGIIRFQVSDHVEFDVNLDRANSVSLKIPTKVLEVAREVLDNGVVRRRP